MGLLCDLQCVSTMFAPVKSPLVLDRSTNFGAAIVCKQTRPDRQAEGEKERKREGDRK
jgi:hypothetical protein